MKVLRTDLWTRPGDGKWQASSLQFACLSQKAHTVYNFLQSSKDGNFF